MSIHRLSHRGFAALAAFLVAVATPCLIASVLLAPVDVAAHGADDDAGEEDDDSHTARESGPATTLADRIPAVTGRVFGKEGRVELAPLFGLSATDPFYQHLVFGLGVSYHILEQLSVGASGEFFGSIATPVQVTGGVNDTRNYDRPAWAARGDVTWAPIYGKLSLMAENVLHFDTYITVSGGIVGPVRQQVQPAGGGALGQRYFVNDWIAIRLESRVQFWEMFRHQRRNPQKALQTRLTVSLGVSFFLPTEFEREKL